MIQINPLQSYINGGARAAITSPPSASLVFDLPGRAIWAKGVKLKGTDHTYTFSHDNYISLTNTPGSNESEDILIGININAIQSQLDSWRPIKVGNIDALDSGVNSGTLTFVAGTGISLGWDATNKKITITNSSPDVNHDTHYTTSLYIGEDNNTKANAAVSNPYLKLFDNSTRRSTLRFVAGTGITITSDADGNIAIVNSAPDVNHNTDTTVIDAAHHYSPTANNDSELTASPSGAIAAWSIDVVTGVKIQRDAKGHVTGVTVNSGKLPANPNSNTWRNIYVSGTSCVGTAISTKAMNFSSSNLNISYLAAGTSTGLSGNANYFTIGINAKNWAGATDSADGTAGYMPAPTSAQRGQFLRGDGTWVSLNNYSLPTASSTTLGGIKVGSTLAISSGVLNLPTTGVTAGTYRSVTVDAYGRVTAGDSTDSNTWRNVYTGGTSRIGTGTGTKAINFAASGNLKITYLAAGTGTDQSGNASYFTIRIDAAANALNTAGYVAAPTSSNANMVWKCDADGNPGWRADANSDRTGIKLGTVSGTKKTDSTVIINNSSTGLTIAGGTNLFSIGDGTNYILVPIAVNRLNTIASISGDTHAAALKTQFTNNKANIPRNVLINYYSSAYGNGSQYFGYFLSGYDSNPYGGFFVAHYNACYYVGISNGTFTQWELSKVGHKHAYTDLTGSGTTANLAILSNGTANEWKLATVSLSNHTHSLSIAADTGASSITLSPSSKYKLTAGGSTYVFTSTSDQNVKQSNNDNNQNSPILLKNGTGTGDITSGTIFADGVTVNPNGNSLTVSGTITTNSGLYVNGVLDSGAYSQGGYDKRYNNIILKGDSTYGVSGITFLSYKGATNINNPSDVAFIQYHAHGVTAAPYNTTPTEASSGELGRLVIGIANDTGTSVGEELWLQTAGGNDLKHYVVGSTVSVYTILDTGNILPSLPINENKIAVTVGGITSSYITVPYATLAGTIVVTNKSTHPSSGSESYYIPMVSTYNGNATVYGSSDFFMYRSSDSNYLNIGKSGITSGITFHRVGETSGAYGDLIAAACTAKRTWTLPNKTGTIALTSDIPTKASWNYDDKYVKKVGDTMTGQLYINYAQDVNVGQNGSLVIGNKGGNNIAIDDNEIMARNNSSTSTLYIQDEGGILNSGASTNYFRNNVGVGTLDTSEKLTVNGWVGTIGNTGWYNITHGGGINMSDTTWVRVYNGKKFYVSNGSFDAIYTSGAFRADGNPYFSSYSGGTPWPYLRICSRASTGGTYTTISQDNWAEFYYQIPAKRNSDSYIYPPMWFFRQYSYNSSGQRLGYYEDYYLPGTNKDRSNNAKFNILTSKNTYVSSGKGYIGGTEITYVNSAGSASSVPWTGVTSQMQGGNEFNIPDSNFGYTGFWFNHLPRNSRSNNSTAVTDYHFGNLQKGKAYLNAKGYKMDGSSNSYVLLGGGSHKAISDFSLAGHTHDRLVSQGNLAPETGRTSARGGVYTYNAYSLSAAPDSYTSIIGFGRNAGGHAELCIGWTGGGFWYRFLRNTEWSWSSWVRVFDDSHSIIPSANTTYNIGSPGQIFNTIYFKKLVQFGRYDGSFAKWNGRGGVTLYSAEKGSIEGSGSFLRFGICLDPWTKDPADNLADIGTGNDYVSMAAYCKEGSATDSQGGAPRGGYIHFPVTGKFFITVGTITCETALAVYFNATGTSQSDRIRIYAPGSAFGSDRRIKRNIENIPTSDLENLYNWSKTHFRQFNFLQEEEKSYGVIAQEMEEILPEVVVTAQHDEDDYEHDKVIEPEHFDEETGELIPAKIVHHIPDFKHLDYIGFHNKLLAAMINEIEKLKAEISELKGNQNN